MTTNCWHFPTECYWICRHKPDHKLRIISTCTIFPQRGRPCLEARSAFSQLRKVASQIITWFTMIDDYCTVPDKQELTKDGLILRPASFRGWGKNSVEGNRGLDLYVRKYGTCIQLFPMPMRTYIQWVLIFDYVHRVPYNGCKAC